MPLLSTFLPLKKSLCKANPRVITKVLHLVYNSPLQKGQVTLLLHICLTFYILLTYFYNEH